jgi:hypothetical protein
MLGGSISGLIIGYYESTLSPFCLALVGKLTALTQPLITLDSVNWPEYPK